MAPAPVRGKMRNSAAPYSGYGFSALITIYFFCQNAPSLGREKMKYRVVRLKNFWKKIVDHLKKRCAKAFFTFIFLVNECYRKVTATCNREAQLMRESGDVQSSIFSVVGAAGTLNISPGLGAGAT